ncbi:MAG TPA: hypothetical protein VK617_01315 [Gemmatimonadaceae bacterium]|nr:hypothetical protein [Gemmatimonadaceae bacterium]
MKVRFLVLIAGAGAAAVACADPLATTATLATIDDTAAVYALTGAPESAPTAINITFPRAVITTPGENYDVVFDIRNDSAFAFPPHAIGAALTAGLQLATQPFGAITQAPTSGYNDTLPVFIKTGDVLLVQSTSVQCATQTVPARTFIYAKVVIDSIFYDEAAPPHVPRTIWYRLRNDPNCGFLSFADGIPKS